MYRVRVVELEVDILNNERPDFVTESVCVKMALKRGQVSILGSLGGIATTHFECQSSLDLVCQNFCDRLVEICEDLHGELGLDSAFGDETIQSVCESAAETVLR